jgi:hypothetical protein
MRTLSRKRRIRGDVYDAVEALAKRGWTAGQINEAIKANFKGKLPTDRTIRRIVRDVTPADASGPWKFGDSDDPDEARAILRVLAYTLSLPHAPTFTKAEGEWVGRIAAVAPDLEPMVLWLLAREYLLAEERNQSTLALDVYLATQPWKGSEANDAYNGALARLKLDPPSIPGQLSVFPASAWDKAMKEIMDG